MPEISRFLGIVIGMFYSDHGVPHFHAVYREHEASIEIESDTIHGTLPPRALRLYWNGRNCTKQNYWKIGSWPGRASFSSASNRWSKSHELPRG
ncbi:MAG: DUF4160 domain-containing protein [Acidobacteriota bacterium]